MRDVVRNHLDWLSLFAVGLATRAALIGLAPHHDEGAYASQAYFLFLGYTQGLFTANSVLPPSAGFTGPLELYALLRSWVFFFPAEPLLLLRLIDAIIAALGGVMMYRYLCLVTGQRLPAFLGSVLVIIGMNHPEFVEAGSRNPIAVSTLLLFCTLYLLERDRGTKLILPACCMALAVLLREPFAHFAITVAVYVWYRNGFRAAAKFCGIAGVLGVVIFTAVAALKGGVGALGPMIHSYTSTHFSSPEFNLYPYERAIRAVGIAMQTAVVLWFIAPVLFIGLVAPAFDRTLRGRGPLSIYVLSLALMLAPWAEILLKLPYSYHVAQMLIGASIPITYGVILICRMVAKISRAKRLVGWSIATTIVLAHVWLLQDYLRGMRYAAGWSLHFAPVMVLGDWNSPVVNDAYYLKVASLARKYSEPDDRILSTSSPVYPLARRIPVTRETSDLAMFLGRGSDGKSIGELTSMFRQYRPPVFVDERRPPSGQVSQELEVIHQKLRDQYHLDVAVGPGLSPYRSLSATVHIRDTKARNSPQ